MIKLEDLDVYKRSIDLANTIYYQVDKWDHFYQRSIGMQLVTAADSIAANLSEGFGRYHYKENRTFCFYARGSLLETKTHLQFAGKRALFNEEKIVELMNNIEIIHKMLDAYIKSIGPKPNDQ